MKKTLFPLLTLLRFAVSTAVVHAQTWCVPGATWYHDYVGFSANQTGVVRTECIGDTVILGETVHLAHATANGYDSQLGGPFSADLGFVITKADADQVSYWDGGDWHTLFDLSVPVNGQWLLVSELEVLVLTVVGTGQKNVDGAMLRYSAVSLEPPLPWLASDTVIERIGFKSIYMNPNRTIGIQVEIRQLRCYEDSEIEYSALENGTCDFTLSATGASNNSVSPAFPNPGTDGFSLLLNGEARNGTLVVTDALGRQVGTTPIKQSQARFDARHLESGAYLYHAVDAQGVEQAVGRWVKE